MQVPVRLAALPRPQAPPAVLLSFGVATLVFSASPFLIDAVADHYDVRLATSPCSAPTVLGEDRGRSLQTLALAYKNVLSRQAESP